ncbi:MAG: cytidyltransferase-related domain protein [Ruminococcaceae bacterium]|nr:cytidyltransferase-related domain protein [Oscillospiraceae bacterium]
MNKKAERTLQNTLAHALCARGLAEDERKAAEALRETGALKRLGELFPLRKRLVCAEVALACEPLLGGAPERGWCAFCYDFIRARMYPQGRFAPDADRFAHGALLFLTILQELLLRERQTLPFDPMYDFAFLSPEEYEACDHAEEYHRFLTLFRDEFIYELMRLGDEVTPYRTLSHIAGVHHIALTVARGVSESGGEIDLALVSAAATAHDLGKYGCRPGEAVPHLHYYYTGFWLEKRSLNAISHIASNHSTWDLELDALSVESLCLIYADVRCKQSRDSGGNEVTSIYSLADAFHVILQKLENVDAAKHRRYELVYSRLQDFERYLRALGADVELTGAPGAPAEPKDAALMTAEESVERLMLLSMEHHLRLMNQLSSERRFGGIIEAARASRDWKELRVYLNIFEAYCTYLSARQKRQALAFLYELLSHREGDIRRQAASLIGQIIAQFHLVYRKRLPDDAASDPAEEVPFTLWAEYLEKIIHPDHKTTAQQRSHIGYTLKLVVDAMLKSGRSETLPRFIGALLRYYNAPEEKDDDTAFTLLDAIQSLPAQYYGEETRAQLVEFAAHFALHGDTRLQTAALLFLQEAQRPLAREHPTMRRIAQIVSQSTADEGLTLQFLRYRILRRAGEDVSDYREVFDGRRDITGDIFLDNLKTATPWVNKVVGVSILRDQAGHGETGSILHICTHFSNLIKVSERVVVRHAAGAALLDVLPLLRREQRNEVVVELGKGIELGQYSISKYIPDYLGRAVLLLHPSELDEQVLWLRALLGSPTDSAVAGALRTIGVMLQGYEDYPRRFAEPSARYTERRHELIGLLLQGLAHYREPVRQEALLVFGQLFDGALDMAEREQLFTLCCRKLLFLIDDAPDGDALTFFYRASTLSRIDRFLTLHKLERGAFHFERPRRIAFFPGTFDPFTLSHKGIVRMIREMGFEVYLAVDEFSWSKKPQPHLLRRQIINMSVAGDFHVYLFPNDIPINIANPADLRRLRELFGTQRLCLVVGADVVAGASAYRKEPEPYSIHSLDHIIFRRPDQPKLPSKGELHLSGDVTELQLPPELEDISSTRIRENVDQNRDISHFIDPIIQDFIYQNGLYLRDSKDKPLLVPSDIAFDWLTAPYADMDHPALQDSARENDELLALRHGKKRAGFVTWRYLSTTELFAALGDAALSDRVRLRAGGKVLLITGVFAEGDDAQLLLSETLARSLQEDCVYALFRPRHGMTPELEELLMRQGFVRHEGGAPLLEADMRAPTVLIRNLETTIQEPLAHDCRVLAAIDSGHQRLQHALTGLYPGSLVLTLSSDVIHQRLLERVTAFNHVPDTPTEPRTLGECMCVPFGKLLRGRILPNTVTKTIHTDKVYEPDLRSSSVEAFPYYPPIPYQVRTIRSFARPVILVDDVMHPGTRIRALDPLLRREGIDIRMVLVGLLSGHGRDLMREQNRPVDGAYFVPTLRQWFVESTLYPFIGGNTVRRASAPVPGLLPGINHILPYAAPTYQGECPDWAVFALSRCCLESAHDLMLALEAAYREHFARNLTLSRLSEAVILPLCPDKGACLRYDPSLAASVYLENDLEQLMRSAGL